MATVNKQGSLASSRDAVVPQLHAFRVIHSILVMGVHANVFLQGVEAPPPSAVYAQHADQAGIRFLAFFASTSVDCFFVIAAMLLCTQVWNRPAQPRELLRIACNRYLRFLPLSLLLAVTCWLYGEPWKNSVDLVTGITDVTLFLQQSIYALWWWSVSCDLHMTIITAAVLVLPLRAHPRFRRRYRTRICGGGILLVLLARKVYFLQHPDRDYDHMKDVGFFFLAGGQIPMLQRLIPRLRSEFVVAMRSTRPMQVAGAAYTLPHLRLSSFLVGVYLALSLEAANARVAVGRGWKPRPHLTRIIWLVVLVLVSVFALPMRMLFAIPFVSVISHTTGAVIQTLPLFAALLPPQHWLASPWLRRVTSHPAWRWFSERSFAAFAVHGQVQLFAIAAGFPAPLNLHHDSPTWILPAAVTMLWVASVVLSYAVAAVVHAVVEVPGQHLRRRLIAVLFPPRVSPA